MDTPHSGPTGDAPTGGATYVRYATAGDAERGASAGRDRELRDSELRDGAFDGGARGGADRHAAHQSLSDAGRPRRPDLLGAVRQRPLVLALGLLALLLVAGIAWWANPERSARRELAAANGRIAEKERAVLEARQLLERRIAELREAKAAADVEATVYSGVLEREARVEAGPPVESRSAAGEVAPSVSGEPVRVTRP